MISVTGEEKWLRSIASPRSLDGGDFVLDGITLDISAEKRASGALAEAHATLERQVEERTDELDLVSRRLRAIMNNVADGVATIDENGVVESFNPAAEKMFGYRADEVIGRQVTILMTGSDNTQHDGYVRRFLDTGEGRILGVGPREVRARGKDGSSFPIELAVSEMKLGGRRVFIGAMRDVTLRKDAEEALQRSEAQFEMLYNDTPAMLMSFDSDANLISVSDYWLRVMGYSREEVVGRKITELLTESSRRDAGAALEKFIESGTLIHDVPRQFVRKDGEVIDVLISGTAERDESGAFIRSLSVAIDVTERKRAEEALSESEERYRKLVEVSSHGVQEIDTNGVFTFSNPAHHRMLGCADGEIPGMTMWDFVESDSDKAELRSLVGYLVAEQPPPAPYIARVKARDGRDVNIEVDWNYKRDLDGNLVGFVGLVTDVTERKLAETALRESEERYRGLVDASPDAIFVHCDGAIVFANPSTVQMLGAATADDLIGIRATDKDGPPSKR